MQTGGQGIEKLFEISDEELRNFYEISDEELRNLFSWNLKGAIMDKPKLGLVNSGDKLLNMDETASLLGVKKSTIYSLCMRKTIPFVKIGRLNRFRRQDLDKWIDEHVQRGLGR